MGFVKKFEIIGMQEIGLLRYFPVIKGEDGTIYEYSSFTGTWTKRPGTQNE